MIAAPRPVQVVAWYRQPAATRALPVAWMRELTR
ncbi:hypothetical protein SAMN06264365_10582 [Actinoplanes regularis]|uniref:Uncharacterized protein n=1 Tax=Actinoplanes regularis TaxID=52697 RepID=A0A238YQN7_9ACTN|nr:hypothetical protein SAMN06264365_10582 [Actinoplanes regularis]